PGFVAMAIVQGPEAVEVPRDQGHGRRVATRLGEVALEALEEGLSPEGIGQLIMSDRATHVLLEGGVDAVAVAHLQDRAGAERHAVPLRDLGGEDPVAIAEGAVRRVEIPDDDAILLEEDLHVLPRGALVDDPDVGARAAANRRAGL